MRLKPTVPAGPRLQSQLSTKPNLTTTTTVTTAARATITTTAVGGGSHSKLTTTTQLRKLQLLDINKMKEEIIVHLRACNGEGLSYMDLLHRIGGDIPVVAMAEYSSTIRQALNNLCENFCLYTDASNKNKYFIF